MYVEMKSKHFFLYLFMDYRTGDITNKFVYELIIVQNFE